MAKRRVQVGKVDLDTVGAAYFLGVTREDKVEVLRGEAIPEDLADPEVICIEVGGSGQTQLNNWDHHGRNRWSKHSRREKPMHFVFSLHPDFNF